MERIKRNGSFIGALIFMAMVIYLAQGCAHREFRVNAYKTLAVSATIYESGYPAFLELHQKGLISDAEKANGKELAIKFWVTYHMARMALEAYDAIQSAENKDRVTTALSAVQKYLSELTIYIQPFFKRRVQ